MTKLKGVGIGAGYFSQFHYDAWKRIPQVEITAVCDVEGSKAEDTGKKYAIPQSYTDFREMFAKEKPDFVDVITPPETHLEICQTAAAERSIAIICQKPLAPTFEEAKQIVSSCKKAGVPFMVHENFRFQPWHREIKHLLANGAIGEKLHTLTFRSRPGDGWGQDAYLNRQPYFRNMPRLLIYETGIHFIDTFRFLAGDVKSVFCHLRRLNPVISGEDCGLLFFEFENGAVGIWDANRFNESNSEDPRYTFGEFLVEGIGGSIRLAMDGTLTIQELGQAERPHPYKHERKGFGGDCVFYTQQHFVDCLVKKSPFETGGEEYLKNLIIQEAMYKSNEQGLPISLAE